MGWYEAIKDVITVADKLKNAELKQKMADVQMECAKLAEDNARMRQELIEFREEATVKQEMLFQGDVYWRKQAEGGLDGPFCPSCFDGNGKVARMQGGNTEYWYCPVCKHSVNKTGGRERVSYGEETDLGIL